MSHFYLVLNGTRVDAVFRYYMEAHLYVKSEGGKIMRDDTFARKYGEDASLDDVTTQAEPGMS
jgi:hypothetical protein